MLEKKLLLSAETDAAENNIESLTQEVKELGEEVDKSKKALDGALDKVPEKSTKAKKGLKGIGTGFKAIGSAMKAAGIGLIIALLGGLASILGENQVVMDALSTVMTSLQIVFNKVKTAVVEAYEKASEATGGFDAMKAVVVGLLTIAITPLKLAFYSIKLAIQTAQLAWETSMFGDNNPATILALTKNIIETKDAIVETGKDAVEAGKSIAKNAGEAVGELVTLTKEASTNLKEVADEGLGSIIKQAKGIVDLRKNVKLAIADNQLLLEQYDRQAEKLRQVRDDDSVSIEDRKKANDELGVVLNEQATAMTKNADLAIQLARTELSLNDSTENQVALKEALAEKAAILAQVEGFRSEQLVNGVALLKEQDIMVRTITDSEAARAKAARDYDLDKIDDPVLRAQKLEENLQIDKAAEEARLQSIIDSTAAGTQARTDAEQDLLNSRQYYAQKEIELAENTANTIKSIEQTAFENKLEIINQEYEIGQQKIDIARRVVTAVGQFAEDEADIQKALLIAKQLLVAAELVLEIKKTIALQKEVAVRALAKAAEAGVDIAAGTAKAASTLNPIIIAGWALTAVSVIAGIAAALRKTEAPDIDLSTTTSAPSATPNYNVAGTTAATTGSQAATTDAVSQEREKPLTAVIISQQVDSRLATDRAIKNNSGI